jgi:hypothetical protein
MTAGAGVRYALSVVGLTSPLYVRDITFNDRSISHEPLVVDPSGVGGTLRVLVADDAGEIVVTVRRGPGLTHDSPSVLVLPALAQTEGELSSGLRSGQVDENGRYVVTGLPPGPYDVLATTDLPASVMQHPSGTVKIDRTPETMAQLLRARTRGERVEVAPAGRVQVSLAPTAWR